MKYIIDTDKLLKDIHAQPFNDRQDRVMVGMRGLIKGVVCVPWAELVIEKKACPKAYSGLFEEFWKCYPKKLGKGAAWKSWWTATVHLAREGEISRACLETLSWQRECESWTKDDGKFIPHAATWLNQCRWTDEDPEEGRVKERVMGPDGVWREV